MKELEATLLTQTYNACDVLALPSHMERSFLLRVVKGLELPATPALVAPGINHKDNVNEEPIRLPDEKIGRLAEFVSRIIVAREPLYRNCVTFVAFMHSGVPLDTARFGMGVCVSDINEVALDNLRPGSSHLIYLADQRTAVHGVVGINDPTEHLAVWGDNSPLAIASNSDMIDTYQAAHVMRVDGYFDLV